MVVSGFFYQWYVLDPLTGRLKCNHRQRARVLFIREITFSKLTHDYRIHVFESSDL